MFEKFGVVKKAGLVKMPTTKSTAIAGTSASSRTEPSRTRRAGPPDDLRVLDRSVRHAATSIPSAAAISSCRSHGASRNSRTIVPRRTTSTRVQMRSSSRSSETSSTAHPVLTRACR